MAEVQMTPEPMPMPPPPPTPPPPPPVGGPGDDIAQDAAEVTQETATAAELTAKAQAETAQAAQDARALEAEILGDLQSTIAAKDTELATLKAKLADAEQRAALPPYAGNPAPGAVAAPTDGYALIRKAVEGG